MKKMFFTNKLYSRKRPQIKQRKEGLKNKKGKRFNWNGCSERNNRSVIVRILGRFRVTIPTALNKRIIMINLVREVWPLLCSARHFVIAAADLRQFKLRGFSDIHSFRQLPMLTTDCRYQPQAWLLYCVERNDGLLKNMVCDRKSLSFKSGLVLTFV